jgi:hypothetical protein
MAERPDGACASSPPQGTSLRFLRSPGVGDGFGLRQILARASSGLPARFLHDEEVGVRLPVSTGVIAADGGASRPQLHSLLRMGMEPRSGMPHPGASRGHPGRFSSIGRIAEVRWEQRRRGRKQRFVLPQQASGRLRASDGWRRQKRSERRHKGQDWRSGEHAGSGENRASAFRAPTNGGGNRPRIETLSASDEIGEFDSRNVRSSRRTQDRTLSASDGVGEFDPGHVWLRTRAPRYAVSPLCRGPRRSEFTSAVRTPARCSRPSGLASPR